MKEMASECPTVNRVCFTVIGGLRMYEMRLLVAAAEALKARVVR